MRDRESQQQKLYRILGMAPSGLGWRWFSSLYWQQAVKKTTKKHPKWRQKVAKTKNSQFLHNEDRGDETTNCDLIFVFCCFLHRCKPNNFHVGGMKIQSRHYLKPPNYILKFPEGSQGNFHTNPSCTQGTKRSDSLFNPSRPSTHPLQTAATSTMRINKQMCHTHIMLYSSACIKSRYREPRRGLHLQEREREFHFTNAQAS